MVVAARRYTPLALALPATATTVVVLLLAIFLAVVLAGITTGLSMRRRRARRWGVLTPAISWRVDGSSVWDKRGDNIQMLTPSCTHWEGVQGVGCIPTVDSGSCNSSIQVEIGIIEECGQDRG